MDLNLAGKVVIITGGSKGIGLACAQAFAAEGARVGIISRGAANLQAAVSQLKAEGHDVVAQAADLADPAAALQAVAAIEAALGPVDILVNSAGGALRTVPAELNAQAWRAAMDAKYFCCIHAMDAVLKTMTQRRSGAIVNIIGSGGKVASPIHLPGGAANAALMLVSAGLANAWGSHGIRVNAINPGATSTTRVQEGLETESRLTGRPVDELRQAQEARIPLGRYARPEEIANTALFLASDKASYVTGALVAMDGGQHPMVV
ncbi:MAG: SDR family oxidoreductase [Polaromonas sp.]|nr:SDR family oxidoreductase [Polaromonas sp.]